MQTIPPFMRAADGYCYPTTLDLAGNPALSPWYGEIDAVGRAVDAPHRSPWLGRAVVCIASGPSLTEADCELVRKSGLPTIAVNSSWRRAPFADVLYAADYAWWQANGASVTAPSKRWTCSIPAVRDFPDMHLHVARSGAANSGARAIELAATHGATWVLLLGYDCSIANGLHWHGAHTATGNPTARECDEWLAQFDEAARTAASVGSLVINCSRETALTCFDRVELALALGSLSTPYPSTITGVR